jgi:excinuclease UvrABC nuclease subunit
MKNNRWASHPLQGEQPYDALPTETGVYAIFFFKEDGTRVLVYIGSAQNIKSRIKQHIKIRDGRFMSRWFATNRVLIKYKLVDSSYLYSKHKLLEKKLIRRLNPVFNSRCTRRTSA